jgi:O-antigen ligase
LDRQAVSQIVRKPWGGQLQAGWAPDSGEAADDWIALIGEGLRKFAELSLMTAVLAIPFVYHLALSQDGIDFARRATTFLVEQVVQLPEGAGNSFFQLEVFPYLSSQLPILPTKFSAWFLCGMAMMAGYAGLRMFEAATGRHVLTHHDHVPVSALKVQHRMIPLLGGAAFLLFSLASLLFWPPAMPLEASLSLRAPTTGGGLAYHFSALGGGGFFYSMVAWLQVVFALFFFLVAEDLIRDRPYVNKLLGLLIAAGFLNALMVILLKIQPEWLMSIWLKFSADEHRNNLGSFIGHNTGVSSFMMAPTLLCMAWLFGVQGKERGAFRVLLACMLVPFALAHLLCQSRAVIPILVVATAALLVALYRTSCFARLPRWFLMLPLALVLVLATQLIPSRYNPVYREDVSLTQRVEEFRYHRLRTETRLRILWISALELVPRSPLVGHGWASFQYVYPTAAGRFFADHPNTELAPTPKRTPQAHNEYLQTLVEVGVIGLVLAIASLFFVLRGGWTVLRRTLMPYHMVTQFAIFLSILALLLHCAVDFPLRVPPLGFTLVLLLAIWSAGDRLWLFSLRAPTEEVDSVPHALAAATPEEPVRSPKSAPPHRFRQLLGGAIALLFSAILTVAVAAFSGPAAAQWVTANSSVIRAGNYLTLHDMQPSHNIIFLAIDAANNAKRIFWIFGDANLLHAQSLFGDVNYRLAEASRIHHEGDREAAVKMANYGVTRADAAVSDINMSLTEQNHHGQPFLRHLVRERLAAILGPRTQRGSEMAALSRADLVLATEINPGDPMPLISLIAMVEREGSAGRPLLARTMRTLNYFHPSEFRRTVYIDLLDAKAVGEVAESRRVMDLIREPGFIDRGFRGDRWFREGAPTAQIPDLIPASSSRIRDIEKLIADDDLRLVEASILHDEGRYAEARDVALAYMRWFDSLRPQLSSLHRDLRERATLLYLSAQLNQIRANIALDNNQTLPTLIDKVRTQLDPKDLTLDFHPVASELLVVEAAEQQLRDGLSPLAEQLEERASRSAPLATLATSILFDVYEDAEGAAYWMEIRRRHETPLDGVEASLLTRIAVAREDWVGLREFFPVLRTMLDAQKRPADAHGYPIRFTPNMTRLLEKRFVELESLLADQASKTP